MMLLTLLILVVRRTHVMHEPSKWPYSLESVVAQWLEHLTDEGKVMG